MWCQRQRNLSTRQHSKRRSAWNTPNCPKISYTFKNFNKIVITSTKHAIRLITLTIWASVPLEGNTYNGDDKYDDHRHDHGGGGGAGFALDIIGKNLARSANNVLLKFYSMERKRTISNFRVMRLFLLFRRYVTAYGLTYKSIYLIFTSLYGAKTVNSTADMHRE